MASILRNRASKIKQGAREKRKLSGWVLEKQASSFADEGVWTNVDLDVVPLERRTWTALTMFGFWFSDAMNAQSWMAPATILAVGLTWREAIVCIIFGSTMCTVPLVLNGMIGARLHVPYPVAARSGFGWYFSRFAIVVRMITALFWHAIQTYTGSTAITQMIRAIWPSYLDIPNHLPASAGITSQQMISHFIFWTIQFPVLLTPPHKLMWFFQVKVVVVLVTSVAVVITMCKKAGGAGDIWNQEYGVHGTDRSWLILSSMSSITGGWATMATNIPDFTRYLKKEQGVYWQVPFLPIIQLVLGLFGIISTSASKVVYGEYVWDPLTLASHWNGPSGRCGAFFVGLCWVIAQIGTNLSANVISCSNDMMSLWPKYINIRRGVIITTIIGGWIMVPWKIIHSAASLLAFMGGLGTFLAPIAAILAADFWIVKKRAIDVPALYRARGRYRYNEAGTNWRAAVAFIISLAPNLPGMAAAVNPDLLPSIGGAYKIYAFFYIWGFTSAFVIYSALGLIFPATETTIPATIHEDSDVISAVEYKNEPVEDGSIEGAEKGMKATTTSL